MDTSSWQFLFGCDIVAPTDTFHSCVDHYGTATSSASVLSQQSEACLADGGTVLTAPCPPTGALGSCIGLIDLLSTSPDAEFDRAYTYPGTGLNTDIVAENCTSDGMPYYPPGSEASAGTPSLTCW